MRQEELKREFHLRLLMCSMVVLLYVAGTAAPAQSGPSTEFEWRFSIKSNQTVSSAITAENTCRRRNKFEIDEAHLPPFMRLAGKPGFNVDSQSRHVVPVQFNSQGLPAGLHEGMIVIKCVTCRENGCSQDRQLLHIYMTVEQESTAAFVPN